MAAVRAHGDGAVGLTYNREADTIYVRLRAVSAVERTDEVGDGRRIDFVGDEPVGLEFLHVRRGIRTDGLTAALAMLAVAAAAFVVATQSLETSPSRPPAPTEADDETAYLLRSPRNRERLLAAYERAMRGEGIPMTLDQLRERVDVGSKA